MKILGKEMKVGFLTMLFLTGVLQVQAQLNPDITSATVSPNPLTVGQMGTATINLDIAGPAATSYAAGNFAIQISFPNSYGPTDGAGFGTPTGPALNVSGTAAGNFNWTYNAGTSVLTGVSNVAIDNTVNGTIIADVYGKQVAASPDDLSINFFFFNGANDTDGSITVSSAGATVNTATPVKLLGFTASKEGSIALLRWGTAEEVNVDRFEILQSLDAKNWKSIASVAALGESTTDHWYSFNDANPANGTNYYRIKSVDRDGATDFSYIQSLEFEIANAASFYPNPVAETLKLKGENLANVSKVTVLNMMGGTLVETDKISASGIDVRQLPAGSYIVRLERKNGSVNAYKVVKQ
ncbi:T9SS type A sorting domain-containing protein [Marinilongibacter aquaticus]|uniref:T9SS type A sorting domain-containing protein n=1 Tax=Marinilongibacter aquaticus TaxID=2975157 RepID=UPI0021BDE268|nr:T9SS type A sorting domain-containing protein [Marinilongibacter aquaticus]UBM60936.1 T9SS type A sorting domain-containing protein [Marinilongibacter aquaticus]